MDLPLAVAKGSSADEAGFSEALSKHDKSVAEAAASARGHAASKDTTIVQYLAANGSSSTGVAPMDSKPDHARDALAGLAPEPGKAGSEAPGSTSALFDDISMTPQPLHLSKVVEDAGTGPYSGRTGAEPLITLSNLPRSRWQHLAVLDIVRVGFYVNSATAASAIVTCVYCFSGTQQTNRGSQGSEERSILLA